MTSDASQRYSARWLFPVDAEPIENGTIEIAGGRIIAVSATRDSRAADLGNVAVIPGLVNAHTHLEFSALGQPLEPAQPFTDWIRAVVAYRRQSRDGATPSIHKQRPDATSHSGNRDGIGAGEGTGGTGFVSPLARGLDESAREGTTTLAEIATTDEWTGNPPSAGPRVVVFRELIGFLPEQRGEQLAVARRHLEAGRRTTGPTRDRGISPHAPYSVHPELYGSLVDLATEFRAPLAIHLSETQDERELLARGTGEFADLLREVGVWREDAIPRGSRPLDYLRPLERLERALVIHGNYLSDEELDFVADRPNLTVVYCPRTHAYFGHDDHPWRKLLSRGGRVALGTDSRASNPDLSLWRELCFLHERHPDVDPGALLRLGTICGAEALGLEAETGTLSAGKSADLAVVSVLNAPAGDAFSLLFATGSRTTATMCAGRWITP